MTLPPVISVRYLEPCQALPGHLETSVDPFCLPECRHSHERDCASIKRDCAAM